MFNLCRVMEYFVRIIFLQILNTSGVRKSLFFLFNTQTGNLRPSKNIAGQALHGRCRQRQLPNFKTLCY
jgi:hypothetical protein